jgi:hypothetical protein
VLPDGVPSFKPKIPILVIVLKSKMLVNVMDIASILLPFGTFYGHFGVLYQEKSGNPEEDVAKVQLDSARSTRLIIKSNQCSIYVCYVQPCRIDAYLRQNSFAIPL